MSQRVSEREKQRATASAARAALTAVSPTSLGKGEGRLAAAPPPSQCPNEGHVSGAAAVVVAVLVKTRRSGLSVGLAHRVSERLCSSLLLSFPVVMAPR